MNLAKDIAFLLYKHNCVIVPGFGAFLVNEKEAELNAGAKFVVPKSKAISFNAQIKSNDGLLANHLSNKNLYSYERGINEVQTYVNELNLKLQDKRNAEVSEVGTFYLTKEEKLIFVPYHSVNFEIASYGLPKLRLKAYETKKEVAPIAKAQPVARPTVAKPIEKSEAQPLLPVKNRIEIQEKKREFQLDSKEENKQAIKRPRVLSLINTLGTVFILALLVGIIYFETTNRSDTSSYADLLSTPDSIIEPKVASTMDEANESKLQEEALSENVELNTSAGVKLETEAPVETIIEAPRKLNLFAVCTEAQADTFAAEKLKAELRTTFKGAFVWNENGNYRVQIVALSKEKIAEEYLAMAQQKIKQQLVIKQK